MPIKNVVVGKESVTVFYCLKKPYGIPDEGGSLCVPYRHLSELSSTPQNEWEGRTEIRDVETPHGKIRFVMERFQELSWGPEEEVLHGPYLAD